MTVKIVDYDLTTGQILRTITWPDAEDAAKYYPGCLYLHENADTNDVRRYVKDRDVVDRPEMDVGFDGRLLTGVPLGASIRIDDETYTADGSQAIEIEFDSATTYRIIVSLWPYMDKEFTHENLP